MPVYIVYDVWILFELIVVYFFFKETQGMSLEATAAIFDGPGAVEDIAAKGELAMREGVEPTQPYELKEEEKA